MNHIEILIWLRTVRTRISVPICIAKWLSLLCRVSLFEQKQKNKKNYKFQFFLKIISKTYSKRTFFRALTRILTSTRSITICSSALFKYILINIFHLLFLLKTIHVHNPRHNNDTQFHYCSSKTLIVGQQYYTCVFFLINLILINL